EHLGVPNEPPVDIQFQPSGYLFLASPQDADGLETAVKVQREEGVQVTLLSPTQLKEKFPWIDTEDVAVASYGTWGLITAHPHPSMSLGVLSCTGEVRGTGPVVRTHQTRPRPPRLMWRVSPQVYMQDSLEYQPVTCAIVVNAAGAWAGALLEAAGLPKALLQPPLPIQPRKRYIFSWHCHDGPGLSCPFLVDTSGAYCRREGIAGNYLGGMSPPEEEEPDPSDLSVDHDYFQEQIWPRLARRIPAFSSLRPGSSWAGYYDHNSFDRNGVVGPHPRLENLLVAAGFSGHGLQHGLAAGRAVAELVLKGRYETLDLSRLGWGRLVRGEPLVE
ncbi:FXRD1 protein, partial [Amazona guildingii]|nr:FXRD1 protein [Amazona guildingii]